MKKLLLLSAVCFIATGASAIDLKPYVEGRLANTWSQSKFATYDGFLTASYTDHTVLGGSLAVGTQVGKFRFELEGFYNDDTTADVKDSFGRVGPVNPRPVGSQPAGDEIIAKSKIESKGLFANVYYDITTINGFTPFVGAGIGYSWLKNKYQFPDGEGNFTMKDKDWGYNVGGGVSYAVNENTAVTLAYRFENLGTLNDIESKTKFEGYKLSLGLRYTF